MWHRSVNKWTKMTFWILCVFNNYTSNIPNLIYFSFADALHGEAFSKITSFISTTVHPIIRTFDCILLQLQYIVTYALLCCVFVSTRTFSWSKTMAHCMQMYSVPCRLFVLSFTVFVFRYMFWLFVYNKARGEEGLQKRFKYIQLTAL